MIFLCTAFAYSQSTIKGVVTDTRNQPLSYARILLKQEGKVLNGATTDENGEYQIFGVAAGTYDMEATGTVGCSNTQIQTGIAVAASEVRFINFSISCATDLPPVTVTYTPPVFDIGKTTQSVRITGDEVRKTPGRSITAALSNLEGVTSVDGTISSVRGNRSDGQQTIIDGVRVRGSSSVSLQAVEEAELIQGGIPAEYGDGTSFTVITTRGVSKDYHGTAEIRGSLDGYGNFLAAASVSGPIIRGKRDEPARLGFMLSGEASYDIDSRPLRGGIWQATDETRENLIRNPLRYSPSEFGAQYNEASYLKEGAFVKRRLRPNADSWNYLLNGKLDIIPLKNGNMRISLTGSYDYGKYKNWDRTSALFDAKNIGTLTNSTLRLAARLNHRVFRSDTTLVKNIMYDININYTKNKQINQNPEFKDDFFKYGHIGKFKTYKARSFELTDFTDTSGVVWDDVYVMNNIYDSLVTFTPGPYNPELVYYTQNFVDQFTPEIMNDYYGYQVPYNLNLYQQFGALINGSAPSPVYDLYYLPGSLKTLSGYSRIEEDALGARASLSMNIGNHDLKLGYEFQKLTTRGYSIAPRHLWTLMREKANYHIAELDVANPHQVGDTFYFDRYINLETQSPFDRNLRTHLGLDPNGSDWIDIDNLDPETFNLGMFSPEELLVGTSGSDGSLITYYGYDYTGSKKYNRKTDIQDFFTATDANGRRTYNIGAYEPVYMSLYLQDKFSIQSLLFNVGVRIDRFDANQSVLKDPYLFREAHTVGSIKQRYPDAGFVGNAQDNWVVYVSQRDEVLSPDNVNSVIAYRDGYTWYDAQGQEIVDPAQVLGANGGPILVQPLEQGAISNVDYRAFEDYAAQWSVMPRISFSFPVSENSMFTAHYNIITSRPTNLQLNPIDYLFIEKFGMRSNRAVNNPNLRSQRSIDYEVGFTQKVGEKSAVGITAYYSEKRDMIQSFRYTGAYPTTYYSYNNQDFGTVQGFAFNYTLRRTRNVELRASYTIQFAKGTGSSPTSNIAIIASGQPNLRTLTNLSFDQRHRLNARIDYRFDSGAAYDGPKTIREKDGKQKTIRWFENAGVGLIFSAASGLPYSRSSTPYSTFVSGTASRLSGTINGSHRPWTFQCDLRIDKTFTFNLTGKNAKDREGNQKDARPGFLMVYLDVNNLFNFKNILYVYTYTGSPEDDGYLSATEYQQQINSQVDVDSYRNYYNMIQRNPYNYSMPTRVSLGIQFTF